jgi:hypothetical protein
MQERAEIIETCIPLSLGNRRQPKEVLSLIEEAKGLVRQKYELIGDFWTAKAQSLAKAYELLDDAGAHLRNIDDQ